MSEKWKVTAERYVCFLDIMGFKDMVARNPHDEVLEKMEVFLDAVKKWENVGNRAKNDIELSNLFPNCEIKTSTFSDSILLISKGNDIRDLTHLLMVIKLILSDCFKIPIPIKGAISKGLLTADFEKSLFFGKPLIHAYELQEEVNYYGVVIDRYVEKDIENEANQISEGFNKLTIRLKTPMKSGRISTINVSLHDSSIEEKHLNELYYSVDGKPRIYVDNTIEMFKEMSEKIKLMNK
jgi:hypothetical protein